MFLFLLFLIMEYQKTILEQLDARKDELRAAEPLARSAKELRDAVNTKVANLKKERDAARKKANAENEKKTAKELGQQQLKTFSRINDLADRINKFQELTNLTFFPYSFYVIFRDS